MALGIIESTKLKNIADEIRKKTKKTDPLSLEDMVDEISTLSLTNPSTSNYYDEFWDAYQKMGSRTDYSYAFYGKNWTDNIFKPKYSIAPINPQYMFQRSGVTDLGAMQLDFSNATTLYWTFSYSSVEYLPYLDCSNSTSMQNAFFGASSLRYIEGLKLGNLVGSQGYARMFNNCTSLETVLFEGIINQDGLDLQYSTHLDYDSIYYMIECLSDDTSGFTVTLSLTAVDIAFNSDEYGVVGSVSPDWLSLLEEKSNWNISLV